MTFKEQCDGWHLTTKELLNFSSTDLPEEKLIGASTHNLMEVKHAEKISMDYVSLSPINRTLSHPILRLLDGAKLQRLSLKVECPFICLVEWIEAQ